MNQEKGLMRIPFNRLAPIGREQDYISEALTKGHLSASGPFTARCEAALVEQTGASAVILTVSATAALEMAALLLDLGEGDEVIMPSYTFVSTANAVRLRGAIPRFVDVSPDTLNISPDQVEAAIGPKTRAIMPVHYAGQACDMDRLVSLASQASVPIVEDAAHAIGSSHNGRALGSIGKLGVFSFHETKNIGCGEGGALLINDPALVERACILRDKGTNRKAFLEGRVDKYSWVDIGSSYGIADPLAAFLLGQIEQLEKVTRRRCDIHEAYARALAPLEEQGLLTLPRVTGRNSHNGHAFWMLLPSAADRPHFLRHLDSRGVQAVFHYVPLHLSPVGRTLGYNPGDLPVTEDIAPRLVRLPVFATLTDDQQARVVAAIHEWAADNQRKAG